MSKKPSSEPLKLEPLKAWIPEEPGTIIEGEIVGVIDSQFGRHYVLEDQLEVRYRLPLHVDLDRKIQSALAVDRRPFLRIEYQGAPQGETQIQYEVLRYPRG